MRLVRVTLSRVTVYGFGFKVSVKVKVRVRLIMHYKFRNTIMHTTFI